MQLVNSTAIEYSDLAGPTAGHAIPHSRTRVRSIVPQNCLEFASQIYYTPFTAKCPSGATEKDTGHLHDGD